MRAQVHQSIMKNDVRFGMSDYDLASSKATCNTNSSITTLSLRFHAVCPMLPLQYTAPYSRTSVSFGANKKKKKKKKKTKEKK
jgi:hypothetical protein